MMFENEMEKINQNGKIESLEKIYTEFIKLGKPSSSGISFSDLYMQDHLGWDTYIKCFFLNMGLKKNLFVLTAFNKRKKGSEDTYPADYDEQITLVKEQAIKDWDNSKQIPQLSHGMLEKPSELLLDLCWFDIETHKMVLGLELEQSKANEEKKLKDIFFDFYKLLYINSEFKIMVSFPYQEQAESLMDGIRKAISTVDTNDDYLIINISRKYNIGRVRNRHFVDYEISGFILKNKIDFLPLEKCTCKCLWKN